MNKKSFLGIISLVIIISLIIASIGWIIVGVVITFDTLSFNPALIDINSSNSDPIYLCQTYGSSDCSWITLDDLNNDPINPVNVNHGTEIQYALDQLQKSNFKFVLNSENNSISAFQTVFKIDYKFEIDNTTFTPIYQTQYLNFENSFLCLDVDLDYGLGCDLIVNNYFRLYKNSSIDCSVDITNCFSPAAAILADINTNQIYCENYFHNCPYEPVSDNLDLLGSGSYKNIDNNLIVNAYGALVDTLFSFTNSLSSNGICDSKPGISLPSCASVGLNPTSISNDYFIFYNSKTGENLVGNLLFIDIYQNGLINHIDSISKYPNNNYSCKYTTTSLIEFVEQNKTILHCKDGLSFIDINSAIISGLIKGDSSIVFSIDTNKNLAVAYGIKVNQDSKDIMKVIMEMISNPKFIFISFNSNVVYNLMIYIIFLFLINIFLGIFVSILKLWKKSSYKSSFMAKLLKGKFGWLLEITQFFNLSGDWYLESMAVHDYNFKNIRSSIGELVFERWKNVFFFPAALSATIGLLLVSLSSPNAYILTLFIAPLMPLILMFWLPFIWTFEDSGLKNIEWATTGEIVSLNRISSTLEDGFHKLFGFSAVFGIGTAGSNAFRSQFTGESFQGLELISTSIKGLIEFNINYIVSIALWTIGLFFIISAISITGIVLTSVTYLNGSQLESIRKFRQDMQKMNIFQGTTQQFFDHRQIDATIYHQTEKKLKN